MFSVKLKELRESKNISQYELAEIIHVSRAAISKWEMGKGLPSDVNLESLCRYFGVTEEKLIGYTEYRNCYHDKVNKYKLVILTSLSLLIVSLLIIFSSLPIYYYDAKAWDSFYLPPNSIFSAVGLWNTIPLLLFSLTICISVLLLLDVIFVSLKKKKIIILCLLFSSILIFIIYFIGSYYVMKASNFKLFFLVDYRVKEIDKFYNFII